jgi:hypothetical protein
MEEQHLQLPCSSEEALAAVAAAAEIWGASWQPDGQGGRLQLPMIRGLRHSLATGELRVESSPTGSLLSLCVQEGPAHLNRSATAVLVLGALGGLVVALWPFFPPLLGLLPVGIVLLMVAWLLVASRLRSGDDADFLELVASVVTAPDTNSGQST